LTTLHGRLDLPDLEPLYREFAEMPLVSISNAQREPIPRANWRGTVHHGIPAGIARIYPNPGRYLAFVGRISPEKRADRAIEIAHRTGLDLKIAAKVDAADRDYFEQIVRPMLSDPGIEFVGEIAEEDKDSFLGNALALLFPIDWPEPFGLVIIESMAMVQGMVAARWRRKTMDLPILFSGSRCASLRKASHIRQLRADVKIFRSRSWILKFSSRSLTKTAQPESSSAFVVISERRSKILGRQRNGPSGSLTASMRACSLWSKGLRLPAWLPEPTTVRVARSRGNLPAHRGRGPRSGLGACRAGSTHSTTQLQRLINQDAGKCFVLSVGHA
jgi:hypothetical protein